MFRILDIFSILGCVLMLATFAAARGAQAEGYKVLYSFCAQGNCAGGAIPRAGLIADDAGNLYGTTIIGGAFGGGTVFKVSPGGTETALYSFCAQPNCADGATPYGDLIMNERDDLFGTTSVGGANGWGAVFKITAKGTETVLHSFCPPTCPDGANPVGELIRDEAGNLYGTTPVGGANGHGVVFKLSPDGAEAVLYSFCPNNNCSGGSSPDADLIGDKKGNLYGVAGSGGSGGGCGLLGCGTVFKLAPDGTETVLHSFQNDGVDGFLPAAGLIKDNSANLYGLTQYGGGTGCGGYGCGAVFKLAPDGTETVLHSFCRQQNCADGASPIARLSRDEAGNLYGTTVNGGGTGCGGAGCGVVFKLAPDGTETVLHAFAGGNDGAGPDGRLIKDAAGNLYGTTAGGGTGSGCEGGPGCGTVFMLGK